MWLTTHFMFCVLAVVLPVDDIAGGVDTILGYPMRTIHQVAQSLSMPAERLWVKSLGRSMGSLLIRRDMGELHCRNSSSGSGNSARRKGNERWTSSSGGLKKGSRLQRNILPKESEDFQATIRLRTSGIEGICSHYGKRFSRQTLCAMRLPRGTRVRLTNPRTGASLIATVNDYGPDPKVHPDRIVDVSLNLFRQLADPRLGLTEVKCEVLE